MNVMFLLQWTGALLGLAVGLLALASAICAAIGLVSARIATIEYRGEARQQEWQKNKLRSTAWWFSEDARTMDLLMNLAELNEWDARERWRKFEVPLPASPDAGAEAT